VRVASGVGLGLAALATFGFAVAMRDGQTWPVPILTTTLVVGSSIALAGGILAVRRGAAGRPAFAAIRVGAGVLLGTAVTALLAGIAILRDLDAAWLALELAILAAATVAVVLGLAGLRALHARSTFVRGWATAGAAFLLILALFIALD
jgi:hypothetical protein